MQKLTKSTKAKEIARSWHLVDAKGKILGRVAVEVAKKLIGKHKPYFVSSLDCGDYVVIINAKYVQVTGHKEAEKLYTRFSGYPGGLKTKTFRQVREERPEEILRRAVFGMLPKNKLRARMITRLHVAPEATHKFTDKFTK